MTSLQEGNKKIEFSSWADGLSSPNCLATWVISFYYILLWLVDRAWSQCPYSFWLMTTPGLERSGATHLCNKDREQQHPPVSLKLLSSLERLHRALEWTWDLHLHRVGSVMAPAMTALTSTGTAQLRCPQTGHVSGLGDFHWNIQKSKWSHW